MNCIKPIGAPGSAARWDQDRQELFDLIGANLLAQGISVTERQSINLTDAIIKHLLGAIPRMADVIAHKWLLRAQKHEAAAREIDDDGDEEKQLHMEVANTLRSCASDIFWPDDRADECFDRDDYGSGSDGW